MDGLSRWSHLDRLCQVAETLGVELWLFGSALESASPRDLDVLAIYEDRGDIATLRRVSAEDDVPPIDLIAMSVEEERDYTFIEVTRARRLV